MSIGYKKMHRLQKNFLTMQKILHEAAKITFCSQENPGSCGLCEDLEVVWQIHMGESNNYNERLTTILMSTTLINYHG